jgi:hypothetical protein
MGSLNEFVPLAVSNGYCTNFCWSDDRTTLLAYVYNVTGHTEDPQWLTGRYHRTPGPAPLALALKSLPGNFPFRVYDLNAKRLARSGTTGPAAKIELGTSDRDYFVLVTPSLGTHAE